MHLTSDFSAPAVAVRRAAEGEAKHPMVVELVGPAGAGKTSALRALAGRDGSVRAGLHISRRRLFPVMARQAIALSPAGLELVRQGPRSWSSGMVQLLRLRTLPAALERVPAGSYRAIALDEGPVYSLARLSVFHGAAHGGGRLAREWRTALEYWARALPAVFWFDAPNAVLIERIRSRRKEHRIKAATDRDVNDFLDRYRSAYRDVLDRMTAIGSMSVVALDAVGQSADQAASGILAALPQIERSRDTAGVR